MFKLLLEKAEEPEIKLPTSAASCKKHYIIYNYVCQIVKLQEDCGRSEIWNYQERLLSGGKLNSGYKMDTFYKNSRQSVPKNSWT